MRIHFFVLFIFASISVNAQEVYSYIGERLFPDQTDLFGYNFRPHKLEKPGSYEPEDIEPGSYSFGVTRGRLYVNGDKSIAGLYEINQVAPTNYGYKISLLNPRNPSNRGHLKVVINKLKEAEIVVFKKESKAAEIIFHLPDPPKDLLRKEEKFYTDLGELAVEDMDSLWGIKLVPYMRKNLQTAIQDRIFEADSTTISFEEVITIKEKKKRKRKRRKKKKSKEEPPASSENITTDEAAAPAKKENVKTKIIKDYFVVIRSKMKYDNGEVEDKVWRYPVKEMEEREDSSARKNEDRFQLAIKTKGRKEIYIYLKGDRTVSSFEADGMLYLMRGH